VREKEGNRVYLRFFLQAFFLPPVARLLCMESLEIPETRNKAVEIPSAFSVWILRKWRDQRDSIGITS
jgi:hypothetical protein